MVWCRESSYYNYYECTSNSKIMMSVKVVPGAVWSEKSFHQEAQFRKSGGVFP